MDKLGRMLPQQAEDDCGKIVDSKSGADRIVERVRCLKKTRSKFMNHQITCSTVTRAEMRDPELMGRVHCGQDAYRERGDSSRALTSPSVPSIDIGSTLRSFLHMLHSQIGIVAAPSACTTRCESIDCYGRSSYWKVSV